MGADNHGPPAAVSAYYSAFAEESRLATGASRLEFARTKEILLRILPATPARVVDVGGAAGAYSFWLADLGYDVHLVDATPRLVDEARRLNQARTTRIATLTVGDARHVNDTERLDYFTTSYFHRPQDLRDEMGTAGFADVEILGVEGIGEWLLDFDERWDDPPLRDELMDIARRLEAEPSVLGMSAHLLGLARTPRG